MQPSTGRDAAPTDYPAPPTLPSRVIATLNFFGSLTTPTPSTRPQPKTSISLSWYTESPLSSQAPGTHPWARHSNPQPDSAGCVTQMADLCAEWRHYANLCLLERWIGGPGASGADFLAVIDAVVASEEHGPTTT
ncbi:RNA helicase SDE3 [Physcia stellaris]|nr:RNA helicase SDE3 [Physcia stellaris]